MIRVCALCDVFDALTCVRPYKDPWPVEDAIAYVERGSGGQFDPQVSECFMRSLPDIMLMREEYREPDAPPLIRPAARGSRP